MTHLLVNFWGSIDLDEYTYILVIKNKLKKSYMFLCIILNNIRTNLFNPIVADIWHARGVQCIKHVRVYVSAQEGV